MCFDRYDRDDCRNDSSILSVISIRGGQLNAQCKRTINLGDIERTYVYNVVTHRHTFHFCSKQVG